MKKLLLALLILTGCGTEIKIPLCKDQLKDGDIVEAVGGNYRGWVGYCKHTDEKWYNEGIRLVVFKVNPLGKPALESGFVSYCDLTKTAKWQANYALPIN